MSKDNNEKSVTELQTVAEENRINTLYKSLKEKKLELMSDEDKNHVNELIKYYKQKSDDKIAMSRVGVLYSQIKDLDQAISYGRRAAKLGHIQSIYNVARFLKNQGKNNEAIKELGNYYEERYKITETIEDLENAIQYYQKYQKQEGSEEVSKKINILQTWKEMEALYEREHITQEEMRVLINFYQQYKEDERILHRLGYLYYQMKEFNKAIDYYKSAATRGWRLSAFNLAALLEEKGQEEEALQWYRKAWSLGYIDAGESLGELYTKRYEKTGEVEDLNKAIKYYEKYQKQDNANDVSEKINTLKALQNKQPPLQLEQELDQSHAQTQLDQRSINPPVSNLEEESQKKEIIVRAEELVQLIEEELSLHGLSENASSISGKRLTIKKDLFPGEQEKIKKLQAARDALKVIQKNTLKDLEPVHMQAINDCAELATTKKYSDNPRMRLIGKGLAMLGLLLLGAALTVLTGGVAITAGLGGIALVGAGKKLTSDSRKSVAPGSLFDPGSKLGSKIIEFKKLLVRAQEITEEINNKELSQQGPG